MTKTIDSCDALLLAVAFWHGRWSADTIAFASKQLEMPEPDAIPDWLDAIEAIFREAGILTISA
jgi:hypothetical protein